MSHSKPEIFVGAVFLAFALMLPAPALAASSKTSCLLTLTTPSGTATVANAKGEVLLAAGEKITIKWKSTNATKATDAAGKTIALQGTETDEPEATTKYTYKFSNGTRKVECAVTVHVVEAGIDRSSLSTTSTKPTITGTAEGTKTVRILIKDSKGKYVFKSKDVKVRNGVWKIPAKKALLKGTYAVELYGEKKLDLNLIEKATLTIGQGGTVLNGGTLSASLIPLLFGGTAAGGTSVPVTYLKLSNTGKSAVSIEGINFKQNGSASGDVVIGFETSDDKGGSIGRSGGVEGTSPFKNGTAFAPLKATIPPSSYRIFTVKAMLTRNIASSVGKQLSLDVTGVDTTANIVGLPVKGTSWVLTY
ncbi:MAG: hypothetical protein AB199_03135 [Parcubacteria bacterium C7867-004]|nr:MAG: hypothetical protein AB199_03135 [Parcubacteria bacterium C7867-004]